MDDGFRHEFVLPLLRRKRRAAVTVLGVLVLVLGSVAGCGSDSDKESTEGATKRVRLVDGPGAKLPKAKSDTQAMLAADSDQGFAAVLDAKNSLWVSAIDIATNRPSWPARSLGTFRHFDALQVTEDALVVTGGVDGQDAPNRELIMLDPATGETRWQTSYSAGPNGVMFFEAAIVVTSYPEQATLGLDWQTGATKWSIPDTAGPATAMWGVTTGMQSRSYRPNVVLYAGSQLLIVSADQSMRSYDVTSGALQNTWQGVDIGYNGFAHDGILYGTPQNQNNVVYAYDLSTTSQPQLIHQAAEGVEVSELTSCVAGLLCIIERSQRKTELAAVKVSTGTQAWRVPVYAQFTEGDASPIAVGDYIVTGDRAYTSDGKPAIKPSDDAPANLLLPVNNSTLLAITYDPESSAPGHIEVVALPSGKRRPLGSIPFQADFPAWNEHHLVVVTNDNTLASARIS